MASRTPAEAFARAAGILEELEAAGVVMPSFTLSVDASGALNLGFESTQEQLELARDLVYSERFSRSDADEVILNFCSGLTYVKDD